VARVERWARTTYSWLGRTRSQRFNVAFAAGSECIAFAMARWVDRRVDDLFDGADPVATTLFLWHLAEEAEHKSVAYDVFEQVDGSRLRYAWATCLSLALLFWFTAASSVIMLRSQKRLRYPVTWFRLMRWSVSIAFTILPTLAASALPGHHPKDFVDPDFLPRWLAGFDPETATMPLWAPRGSALG
jgi:predicted metal-dependent hydrolase